MRGARAGLSAGFAAGNIIGAGFVALRVRVRVGRCGARRRRRRWISRACGSITRPGGATTSTGGDLTLPGPASRWLGRQCFGGRGSRGERRLSAGLSNEDTAPAEVRRSVSRPARAAEGGGFALAAAGGGRRVRGGGDAGGRPARAAGRRGRRSRGGKKHSERPPAMPRPGLSEPPSKPLASSGMPSPAQQAPRRRRRRRRGSIRGRFPGFSVPLARARGSLAGSQERHRGAGPSTRATVDRGCRVVPRAGRKWGAFQQRRSCGCAAPAACRGEARCERARRADGHRGGAEGEPVGGRNTGRGAAGEARTQAEDATRRSGSRCAPRRRGARLSRSHPRPPPPSPSPAPRARSSSRTSARRG